CGALGKAVSMPSMRACNIVVASQSRTHAHSDRLFATVQMSQPGHTCTRVQLVDLLLKQANREHLSIHVQPPAGLVGWLRLPLAPRSRHPYSRHALSPI